MHLLAGVPTAINPHKKKTTDEVVAEEEIDISGVCRACPWVILSLASFTTLIEMVSYWRQAGLSYIRYSAICARAVRSALKPQLRTEAIKNAEANVKVTKVKTT